MNKKIGLVLEGGGHRGIYTAGLLDVFLENKISFDAIMGVSAGCVHGASFLSGQKVVQLDILQNFVTIQTTWDFDLF